MNISINDNNFIAIQGWMRTKLELKGYELLVYALIYGFSQDGSSKFSGTRRYIAEWCGCSMRTVDNTLKSLLSKKLIVKHEKYVNMIRVCDYTAVPPGNRRTTERHTSPGRIHDRTRRNRATTAPRRAASPRTAKGTRPHRRGHNPPQPTCRHPLQGHHSDHAQTHQARLKEGFTVDEFKLVIDKKCSDWLNNRDMAQYLRPETLFGPKFESYLNAKVRPQTNPNAYANANTNTAAQPIDADGHMAQCTRENGWF